ncbi:MAG TPA: hypothetical protein VGM98_22370, partial [Schlesneria sp.]
VLIACGFVVNSTVELRAQQSGKESAGPTVPELQRQSFRLRITDSETNKPIAGAIVQLTETFMYDVEYFESRELTTEQVTTDTEGYYSFSLDLASADLSNRWLKIQVSHPNYLPSPASQQFGLSLKGQLKNYRADKPIGSETLPLHPARDVHGVLQTPDGKPAAHVDIKGFSYRDNVREYYPSQITSRTDGEGRFRLQADAKGSGRYWFLPDDFAPKGIDAGQNVDLSVVTLEPGIRSKGRVVDVDGNPVAAMTVMATQMKREFSWGASRCQRFAVTDSNGQFELSPFEMGAYDLRAFPLGQSGHRPPVYSGYFLPEERLISPSAEDLELRAVPTVEVRLATLNSKRESIDSLRFYLFGTFPRAIVSVGGASIRPKKGLSSLQTPKGTTRANLKLAELPEDAILLKRDAAARYEVNPRGVLFDRIDSDIDIEVIRFRPTRLSVKVVDQMGKEHPDIRPKGLISSPDLVDGQVEVEFYRRNGDPWRSQPLITIGKLAVTVEGLTTQIVTKTISLVEGEEQEVTMVVMSK